MMPTSITHHETPRMYAMLRSVKTSPFNTLISNRKRRESAAAAAAMRQYARTRTAVLPPSVISFRFPMLSWAFISISDRTGITAARNIRTNIKITVSTSDIITDAFFGIFNIFCSPFLLFSLNCKVKRNSGDEK